MTHCGTDANYPHCPLGLAENGRGRINFTQYQPPYERQISICSGPGSASRWERRVLDDITAVPLKGFQIDAMGQTGLAKRQ
jgi:hypothetical protein